MDTLLLILFTVVLVVLNGFFVAAEFALVKVRRNRLEAMAENGGIFARQAVWLSDRLDNALSTCQIGITMASLGLGWIGEPAVATLLEPVLHGIGITSEAVIHTTAFIVGFSIITAAHLVIGEQVPKIMAIRRAETLAVWCAAPLLFFYGLLYPVMVSLTKTTSAMLRMFGITGDTGHDVVHSADELRALATAALDQGNLSRSRHRLIDAAFDFDKTVARQIMLPRGEMAYFDVNKPVADAFAVAKATMHTRYPVCEGSLDQVIGVVHIKDLFGMSADDEVDLRTIMRPPRFVPETARINKLLGHFKSTRQHLVFVVDEHGTLAGMVTLENVLEQIVGAVEDEFDLETPAIVPDGPNRYLISGSMSLGVLRRELGLNWVSREVSTVSGYLTERLERVPVAGDRIDLEDAVAEVITAKSSRANSVRIIIEPDQATDSAQSETS